MNEPVFWIAPIAALLALAFALVFYRGMVSQDQGTDRMIEIGDHVRTGAMAYLRQQYKVMGIAFAGLAVVFAILAWGLNAQSDWLPFTFLAGGLFSALAGFFGMQTATRASTRTAAAARSSLPNALKVAFRSGAVMGLVVVGLGLGNIVLWFLLANAFIPEGSDGEGVRMVLITTTVLTFGVGASMQAMFARVGGGIFTKAADVGADLVGKVESGIP
ncbi:MAG: sodium/proton-translocating pyrophosphatase, partial [Actinomycetota bacterium]